MAKGAAHIIVDKENGIKFKEVTGQKKYHKRLDDGSAYAFCFPLASDSSLSLFASAHDLVYHKLLKVTADGPEMEEVAGIGMASLTGSSPLRATT